MPVVNANGKVEVVINSGHLTDPSTENITVVVEPEVLLAQAVLLIEPEKIEGGSPARQSWIGLITYAIACLHECGYDIHKFKDRMEQ